MSKPRIDYSVYLVTDDSWLDGRTLGECVRQALAGGVTLVQYRSKHKDGGPMYTEAQKLKVLCDAYGVPLIINDRVDLAMAVGAAGVHLGQDDLPCAVARKLLGDDYIVGVSTHNPAEALQAAADGADYLGCGAVFGSATKQGVQELGLANLRAIRQVSALPMVGIGGITIANYEQVLRTGADGAAIVSGILAAGDITAAVRRLVEIRATFSANKAGVLFKA